jgi:hypothetical protein
MSSPIIAKLRAVRRKHGLVALLVAITAVIGVAVLCLGGGMAADRWLELRYGWRAVLLSIYGLLVLWTFWRLAVLALWRGPNLEQAALWVEREEPIFRSRLISTVQFLRPVGDFDPGSNAMVRHVIRETETLAEPIRFTRVVRTHRLRRMAVVVAFVVTAVVGGAVYAGAQSIPLLQRALLVPGIPIPRRTQIAIPNPEQTIARGDTVTLTAIASGVVPTTGTVHIAYDTGETADFALVAGGPKFTRTIGNVQNSFTYTVHLGDNSSADNRVRVVLRPAVVDVKCVQIYPAYTGHADEPRSPWDLTLLTGSRLKIAVKSSMPGKASPDLAGCRIRLAGSDRVFPLVGSINDLTLMNAVDGAKQSIPIPPDTTGFSVELLDADGIWSDDPTVHKITLAADLPPTVRIVTPQDRESTVTPVARQTISVEAEDDYAVGRVDLKYRITRAGKATADESDPHGLTGTYFSDPALVGNSVDRVDSMVDLNWATTPPPAGIGSTFAVRWTGYLRPIYGEPTTFVIKCSDGCRLWIDGNQVIDQWTRGGWAGSKPIPLELGKCYPITMEVRSVTPAGSVMLGWQSSRMQQSAIPHGSLFHIRPADLSPDVAGLVDAWPCDDQTPGYVHDPVGHADGVVYNAKRTDGPMGGAVLFDDSNMRLQDGSPSSSQKVEIASTAAMRFQTADSFTLSARVNAGEPPATWQKAWQGVVTKSREGGNFYGIWIGPGPEHHWAASSPGGVASSASLMTGPAVTPGWHHVALVQDGVKGTRTLYVDGVAAATGKAEAADGWGPMVLGYARTDHGQDEPFFGSICDVRLYGRAVPADQIKAIAEHPQPLPKNLDVAADPHAADTLPIPLGGPPVASVKKSIVWDLSSLPNPPAVGDTIEFWAAAADTNDVSGPGVGESDHDTFRVISAEQKQKELMDRLGDYLGQIHEVSEDQRDLTTKVGELAKPGKK